MLPRACEWLSLKGWRENAEKRAKFAVLWPDQKVKVRTVGTKEMSNLSEKRMVFP